MTSALLRINLDKLELGRFIRETLPKYDPEDKDELSKEKFREFFIEFLE